MKVNVLNKLKISIIAPDLSGGGGTRAYLLAQVIRQLNYDVSVYGFAFKDKLYPTPPSNLAVTSIPGSTYPKFLGSINQLLRQIDGDIIYAVKPRPTSLGVGLLKKIASKKPVILDIDDWELSWYGGDNFQYYPTLKQLARDIIKPEGALRNPNHPAYLKLMEKFINRADAVTADTRFLQNRFGGVYLPNGKDTNLFNPDNYDYHTSREKLGLSPYRVLMFPGTARPHKGLEDVLHALDQINMPDYRLILVGGRDIGDGYIEYLASNWSQWVIRLPQFSVEQMPEVVSAADLIVVPQRNESTAIAQFPIKLTDGMAMAKPILATTVGDIPEILADTGYLVEPQSPKQIAEQIKHVFANFDDAKKRGIASRKRCLKHYSIDVMANILSDLISKL